MGMTIDKAIKMLEEIIDEGWLISDLEKCPAIDSCELAIDIMRKYQKIEQIAREGKNETRCEEIVRIIDGKA